MPPEEKREYNYKVTRKDAKMTCRKCGETKPGRYFLLVGRSKNGTSHVVVCRDGKIVHDPALDNSGIVGPCPDSGVYWVEFLLFGDPK